MKALVYFSLCLELAQTFMVSSDGYDVYAIGFGDIVNLDDLHLLWMTLPILGGIGTNAFLLPFNFSMVDP